MPLSYAPYLGDGANRVFSVPFQYLSADNVKVLVDGLEVPFVFLTSNTVQTTTAPANGAKVRVTRVTPLTEPLITFSDSSNFKSSNLNRSDLQKLYGLQEAADKAAEDASLSLRKSVSLGEFDAEGLPLANVADPLSDTDAANRRYVREQIITAESIEAGQLRTDLTTPDAALGAALVAVADPDSLFAGNTVQEALQELGKFREIGAPTIILDTASTSWAGISSVDYTDNKRDILAELINDKKRITVDTQIAVNSRIDSLKSGMHFECAPGGMLLAGPDMGSDYILGIKGHNTTLRLMRFDNPSEVNNKSGGRQRGLSIQADFTLVEGCRFWRMQNACTTESTGEWYGSKYIGNYAYECLGAGPGPIDDGSSSGEDRGDAFVIWGASGVMIGNHAYCKAGQDARIAFHCEGLYASKGRAPNPELDEKDYILIGNYAHGAFRRHFVFEDLNRGLIANCISAGGASWWALSLVQTKQVKVSGLIIRYTRQAGDQTGASWAPAHAAIAMKNWSESTTIKDVDIQFTAGSSGRVLHSSDNGPKHVGTVLEGIVARKDYSASARVRGFDLTNLSKATLRNCSVSGASDAYYCFGTQQHSFDNCSADDVTQGFYFDSGSSSLSRVHIRRGKVSNAVTAVRAVNAAIYDVRGMQTEAISGAAHDVSGISGTNRVTIRDCDDLDGNGTISINGATNGTFTSTQYRDLKNNTGYRYNFKFDPSCFSLKTSYLNTFGKHTGRTEVGSDFATYTCTGTADTSVWTRSDPALNVTPA